MSAYQILKIIRNNLYLFIYSYISNMIMDRKEKEMKSKKYDILINKDTINLNCDKLNLNADKPGCLSLVKPSCCRI